MRLYKPKWTTKGGEERGGRGRKRTEIARKLGLSLYTVDEHLAHIRAKLGVARTVDLPARIGARRKAARP